MKYRGLILAAAVILGCLLVADGVELDGVSQVSVCDHKVEPSEYDLQRVAADTGIIIPGLSECLIPQGIAWWQDKQCFIISGYMRPAYKRGGSLLMLVDGGTGQMVGTYSVEDEHGKLCFGHFSGVAVSEAWVYVADGDRLHCISREQIEQAGRIGRLKAEKSLDICARADACTYSNGVLWVCEYKTEGASCMVGYRVKSGGELEPECALTVPDRVQGMCFLNGQLVLSRSYGRKNRSCVSVYEDPRNTPPCSYTVCEGEKIPLWFLNEDHLRSSYSAPPMSEGCCSANGAVYLIFESGAYYYRALDPGNSSTDPIDTIWKLDLRMEKPLTGG